MIQGGDYENRNGTGGKSIYGEKFADENFKAKHTSRGLLSMANAGPNTNGYLYKNSPINSKFLPILIFIYHSSIIKKKKKLRSQFFITFKETPWLDGKHVVFGKVVSNIEFLDVLEAIETTGDTPNEEIKVVDSGVVEA